MDNGRTWTMVGHGQWSDMDNGRAWTSLRFLAPGCWLARARVYRTHQITPDERRAPRSRPLTREQSAALRVRAHIREYAHPGAPCPRTERVVMSVSSETRRGRMANALLTGDAPLLFV